jgi:thiamine phosphate synthase YjbQ (UPF0047 family)
MNQSELMRDLLTLLETLEESDSAWAHSKEQEKIGHLTQDDKKTVGKVQSLMGRESLRQELKDVTTQIEKIVDSGGRVGLNDPLSKKLKALQAKLKGH